MPRISELFNTVIYRRINQQESIVERPGRSVHVQAVEPWVGFIVRITFQNGVQKEIDLEPLLRGPIFAPMRNDPAIFQTVKVVGNTIGWDNGADIDPDVLYYDLKPAWMEMEEGVTA